MCSSDLFLMLGFSIGPLVGGVVTHYVGWRMNFWLNVLAMLPAGLVLWLHPRTGGWQTNRVDWLGLGLLAFFMVMLISGLHALATARSAGLRLGRGRIGVVSRQCGLGGLLEYLTAGNAWSSSQPAKFLLGPTDGANLSCRRKEMFDGLVDV